ncbi:MAG: ABC transporter ATP-binding protein [Thiohalomonadales bacterium]
MVAKALIKINQLSKHYTEGGTQRIVLTDISLEIAKGDFIVLLGRSGSGKSTLLNIISGIDTPSAGNVVINDIDLTGLSEHDRTLFRRHNIGFIFQLFNLIPTLTVQENILLPLELTGRLKKGHREHVSKLLAALRLDDRANSFPDKLSGGEQQRVAILRALIHQPELLLADEPTGNLDTESSKTVLGLLKKLVKKEGKTLVLVTHSMEIAQMADKVYLIRDGKLITKTM